MFEKRFILLLLVLGISWGTSNAAIIDHNSVDTVAEFPQATMETIGSQKWYFTHASVGANILDGLVGLSVAEPSRYLLLVTEIGDYDPYPGGDVVGVVYDNHRGNPTWQEKISLFEDAVRNMDWREPNVNVVMNKFCYIDWMAEPQAYLTSMAALEDEFPNTHFVYLTMPLMSYASDLAVKRSDFNQVVRQYCVANDRNLLDIADIEAHDPLGNPVSDVFEGTTVPLLYGGYTTDGGHLNDLGAERVALGWYAMAESLIQEMSPAHFSPESKLRIKDVAPNPFNPSVSLSFDIPRYDFLSAQVFDVKGRLVDTLFEGEILEGEHEVYWNGKNQFGADAPSGIYFIKLRVGDMTQSKAVTLVR